MRLVWYFFFSPLLSGRVKEPFQPLFLCFNSKPYGMRVKRKTILKMDDGKILNAEWESGYDQWSIGQRIILTTENGSGIMFFEKQRTQVAVFPYNPSQIGK